MKTLVLNMCDYYHDKVYLKNNTRNLLKEKTQKEENINELFGNNNVESKADHYTFIIYLLNREK